MMEPLRVVVVEDEAILLMHLEAMVEDAGHIVVGTAMSAAEAIVSIRDNDPDLVLLDMQLRNGSSGLDVMHAVRDRTAITVVFITANARKLTDDMGGAAAVIAKPFSSGMLASALTYIEECVRRPPPALQLPSGLRLAPDYLSRLDGARPAN